MKQAQSILKDLTVLYIEDDNITRDKITNFLNKLVKCVHPTDYVSSALEIYKNNSIDIIISDIDLPDNNSDGLEFAKHIRQTNKNIPIILITAHTQKEYLMKAIKLHIVDYIEKPIEVSQLIKALNDAAEHIIENSSLEVNFLNNFKYDIANKVVISTDDKTYKLTSQEILFLDILLKNRIRSVSFDEISQYIWEDGYGSEGSFKTLLSKLRKKIGKNSILTIPKVGYKIQLKN